MFVILGRKILPLVGHFIVRINCLDRALRNARATIDALFRVNEKLIFPLINTINWAHVDTRRVVLFDTGLRDDICHGRENTGAMRAEQSIFYLDQVYLCTFTNERHAHHDTDCRAALNSSMMILPSTSCFRAFTVPSFTVPCWIPNGDPVSFLVPPEAGWAELRNLS